MVTMIIFLAGFPARSATSAFSDENESSKSVVRTQRSRNHTIKAGSILGGERRAPSDDAHAHSGETSAQSTSRSLPYFQPALAGAGKFKEQFISSVLGRDVVIVPSDEVKHASATMMSAQKARTKRSLRDNPTTDKNTLSGTSPKFRGAAYRRSRQPPRQ